MNKLLIIDPYYEQYTHLVKAHYPDWEVFAAKEVSALQDKAEQCPIWLGSPNSFVELLRLGVKPPRWMQSTLAGIAPLCVDDLPKNYLLSRTVGVFNQLMAEYVLTYMLANERQVIARYEAQKEHQWLSIHPGTLHGKQVLIVGAGHIGIGVAKFLKPFGMKLKGIATTAKKVEPFDEVAAIENLSQYMAEADYVINLLPDTPKTQDIYTETMFLSMKDTAVFINAGRGISVVDDDLMSSLAEGHPKLAVLDVFKTEPLPMEHPLWSDTHVLITEHTAAMSIPSLIFDLFNRNVEKFRNQQPLEGQVDFKKGY